MYLNYDNFVTPKLSEYKEIHERYNISYWSLFDLRVDALRVSVCDLICRSPYPVL